MRGGGGADVITGGDGDDTINGISGNDFISGDAGVDVINGGSGNDLIWIELQDELQPRYNADGSDATIAGDTISGGNGTDELFFDAEDGYDSNPGTFVTITVVGSSLNIDSSTYTTENVAATMSVSAVEELHIESDFDGTHTTVSGALSDAGVSWSTLHFKGEAGDDVFDGAGMTDQVRVVVDGGEGDDTIIGGLGDDIIRGGGGHDVKHGGGGIDTFIGTVDDFAFGSHVGDFSDGEKLILEGYAHDVSISSTQHGQAEVGLDPDGDGVHEHSFTLEGDFSATETHRIVSERVGADLHLSLEHNVAEEPITDGGESSSRADALFGSNEADNLSGRSGNDTLDGNGGDDLLRGGSGNDVARGEDGADVIHAGSGDDFADGGSGDDLLVGGSGDDPLEGEFGADTLLGGSGDDVVEGGFGDDSLAGASGDDVLLGGDGADTMAGGSGDDILEGGAGDDVIRGGSGDDIIAGGSGSNWLRGGGGADIFVLEEGTGPNTFKDFEIGEDLIGLAGGLVFVDLTFAADEIRFGNYVLAALDSVETADLGASDFLIL